MNHSRQRVEKNTTRFLNSFDREIKRNRLY